MWTCRIFFNGKHLNLAFQSVIEFIQSSAPKFFQGLCINSDGRGLCAYCCVHNTLPSGAHAWTMEDPSRQWISWSMEAWHCHLVPQWASVMVLPMDLHLFCRLPWKVSLLAEFFQQDLHLYLQDIDCEHSESWQVPLSTLLNPIVLSSLPRNGKGHVAEGHIGSHR